MVSAFCCRARAPFPCGVVGASVGVEGVGVPDATAVLMVEVAGVADCFDGGEGDGACGLGLGRCEDAGEVVIEAADETCLGAEVCRKAEGAEVEGAEASLVHGAHEALHTGLAKQVDGLLWVADEEDGAALAGPVLREQAEQVVLAGGGVLHLVDEEVLQVEVEGGAKVGWSGVLTQSRASLERAFGKVAAAVRGKDELQLGECGAEDAEECLDDVPLFGGVLGRVADGRRARRRKASRGPFVRPR